MTHTEYLMTPWWRDISEERKRMAQYRCECCDRDDLVLDCHHLRYRDDDGESLRFREAMQDLEVLCRLCHLITEQVKLLRTLTGDTGLAEAA